MKIKKILAISILCLVGFLVILLINAMLHDEFGRVCLVGTGIGIVSYLILCAIAWSIDNLNQ